MTVRLMGALAAMLVAATAHAESVATVRPLFADAWKRSECNQPIDDALNSAIYDDLGGGYSLGLVLCWLGPYQEGRILFLVAPKTGGRPQLLRFEEWVDGKFQPTDLVWMPDYDSSRKTLNSFQKGRAKGDCGGIGRWLWTGKDFRMTDYWDKVDCDGEEFGPFAEYRVFPPRK